MTVICKYEMMQIFVVLQYSTPVVQPFHTHIAVQAAVPRVLRVLMVFLSQALGALMDNRFDIRHHRERHSS